MPTTSIFTSAGTTVSVSAAAPATYDQVGFEALTFTEIADVSDAGEIGREYASVTFQSLGTRGTQKRKGSFNEGAMTMTLGRVPGDAGQTLLIAGRDSDLSYSFKVVLQDTTVMFYSAQIMKYTTNIGSSDQITGASVTLEIDGAIVEVAAA
jgi:hypothetical protein